MGLQIVESSGTQGMEVFQSKNLEDVPGGLTIDQTNTNFETDQVAQKGELVVYDESTRLVVFAKLATVNADTVTPHTSIQVKKGHCLAVGDQISTGADGGENYAITAIDQTNASYDTLTVGTSIGALTEDDVIWLSTGTAGATSGAAPLANGILKNDVKPSANDAVSVVVRGTVYERRLPGLYGAGGVPTQHKTTLTDRILFSQSY